MSGQYPSVYMLREISRDREVQLNDEYEHSRELQSWQKKCTSAWVQYYLPLESCVVSR